MNTPFFGSKTRRIGALAALAVLLTLGIIAGQRWVTEARFAIPDTPLLTSTDTGLQIIPASDDPLAASTFYAVNNTAHQLVTGTTANGSLTNAGSVSGSFTGGDFVGTDYSKLYAVDYTDNNLYTISTSTGAKTLIGNMGTPLNNGTWRDLTWDPTANKMYAMATYFEMDVPVSKNVLYEVNISTGAKTWIGTDAIGLYDGAIDPSTGVFYAISSAYQALYTVNKASGATSFVGFLDTTASFQSLDFDDSDGVLYGITDAGELRTINISNAAPHCSVPSLSPALLTLSP